MGLVILIIMFSAHPISLPESYYNLQKYKILSGISSIFHTEIYKTNLIYSYGRTEDIPYGALFKITAGREFNEFKQRTYIGGRYLLPEIIKDWVFLLYRRLWLLLQIKKPNRELLSPG